MNSNLPTPRADWALFLDFDGTLVEIADSPDAVRAESDLVAVLDRLESWLHGAIAIVSGRPIAEIDLHLDHARFAAAGVHGAELRRRRGGETTRSDASPPDPSIINSLRAFADANPGVTVEDKEVAVALHYRARPDLAVAARAAALAAIDGHSGLRLLEGKMVFELKPVSSDKGLAVRRFMEAPPFAGRLPVFVGDDVTDEDGFRTAMDLGGYGLKIGPGDTAAAWRIDSVSAFLDWLAGLPGRSEQYGEVIGQ
jgi:trehalose 6-phosphate phosphatase